MSTEPTPRRLARALGLWLLACPTVASAAVLWEFTPSVELGVAQEGNVRVVGVENVSDVVTMLGVTLDLSATKPPTTFTFTYTPSRQVYSEFSELDYSSHTVVAGFSRDVSRRSSIYMDLGWLMTEHQAVQTNRPEAPTTLVPRAKQENFYLNLTGRVAVGRLWFFDWEADAGRTDFRDPTTTGLADTEQVGAGLGLGREIGRSADIGARLRGQRLSFETDQTTDAQSVELFYNQDISRGTTLAFRAGAIRATSGADDVVNPGLSAEVRYEAAAGALFIGGARQIVSAGFGTGEPTKDRGIYSTVRSGGRSRELVVDGTAYYWRRTGIAAGTATDIATLEAQGSLAWSPRAGRFALGGFYSYHDQNALEGTDPGLATSYSSAGVHVRWAFLKPRGARERS